MRWLKTALVVALVVSGLAFVAFWVMFAIALSSWGSNK